MPSDLSPGEIRDAARTASNSFDAGIQVAERLHRAEKRQIAGKIVRALLSPDPPADLAQLVGELRDE